MRDYIRDKIVSNIWWILIVMVLCSMLASKCAKEKTVKKNTKEYSVVESKKEALTIIKVPETIVKKFVKIKTITKYLDSIHIDTIRIAYKDSVKCDFERVGELKTTEYSLLYKSNNKGIELVNLNIPDSVLVVSGVQRKWFLGKETNVIDISHSNKYINSGEVQHVEIKPKKRWYDTTAFKVGVGFIGGVLLSK